MLENKEVRQKQNIKMNLSTRGEFNIESSGDISPEVLEQIQQIVNQAAYYKQKDLELSKQVIKNQHKLDSTVLTFFGASFLVTVYLVSTLIGYGKVALENHFQNNNQPVNVKYQKY